MIALPQKHIFKIDELDIYNINATYKGIVYKLKPKII